MNFIEGICNRKGCVKTPIEGKFYCHKHLHSRRIGGKTWTKLFLIVLIVLFGINLKSQVYFSSTELVDSLIYETKVIVSHDDVFLVTWVEKELINNDFYIVYESYGKPMVQLEIYNDYKLIYGEMREGFTIKDFDYFCYNNCFYHNGNPINIDYLFVWSHFKYNIQ